MVISFFPLSLQMIYFNYVTSLGIWTLTETGTYCDDSISTSTRDNLFDCKTHCEMVGSKRLTFSFNKYCRCCDPSSRLLAYIGSRIAQIYTLPGKYMYLPTKTWCRNNIISIQSLLIVKFLIINTRSSNRSG